MRVLAWLGLVCCICFTDSAMAFSNQVSAGIERWTWSEKYEPDIGPTEEGDYTQNEISADYTHFLDPVEDNGEPLDLLPFFYSRSSYVYGNFYSGDYELDQDDTGYRQERDWTGYGLGGLFYVTPDTGIGGGFFIRDQEWKDNGANDDTYDDDRDGWNIMVRHYLDDHNRLSARLSQTNRDRDYANDYERSYKYEWLVLSYDGVVGESPNLYFGADLGKGSSERDDSNNDEIDHDLTRLGFTVGQVYRQLAIYFSWDYYDWDPEGNAGEIEETYLTLSPRYWFDEQIMLGGDLTHWTWDESGDDYDYEESGTGIEVIVRYRF